MFNKKTRLIVAVILLISSLVIILHSFQRDWNMDNYRLPFDLRNRVVGARLAEMGVSPYFHNWKKGDPITLFDLGKNGTYKVTSATSTPFYHRLISPLNALSFFTISKIFCVLNYLFLICVLSIGFLLLQNSYSKSIYTLFISLFTLTGSWINHAGNGQNYLLFAALMITLFFLLRKEQKKSIIIVAAIVAAFLVLVRPIALVFLFPLFFNFKILKRFKLIFIGLLLIYGSTVLFSPVNSMMWKEYGRSIKEFTYINQDTAIIKGFRQVGSAEQYGITEIEGYNYTEMRNAVRYTEQPAFYFNFFRIPLEFARRPFTMRTQLFTYFSIIFALCAIFFFVTRKRKWSDEIFIEKAFLFGFSIYMITEIFSPVTRGYYSPVQWIAILSIFFFLKERPPVIFIIGLLICFFLMIVRLPFFDLQVPFTESLEILILLGCSLIEPTIFSPINNWVKEKITNFNHN